MIDAVLCVDIGTTSLKAGLITASGEVVSLASTKILVNEDDKSFIANKWEPALKNAIKKVISSLKKNQNNQSNENTEKYNFCALSISGNGPTVVTQNGRTELWNEDFTKGREIMNRLIIDAGITTHSLFMPKLLSLKDKCTEDFTTSNFIFSGPEFLIYTLTGNPVTILPEERYVSAYWDEDLLNACKIPVEQMPPYYNFSQSYGEIKSEYNDFIKNTIAEAGADDIICAAEKIPVHGAGPDFIAALIGTNTLKAGRICDRSGSSEGINYCVPSFVHSYGIRTLPSVIPSLWNISVLIPRSGKLSENKRIYAVKEALRTLRSISNQNGFEFPEKLFVTGGQTRNLGYMKRKRNEIGMELSIANCDDAELLGDACVAFYALGKYESLQKAAENIVHERPFV